VKLLLDLWREGRQEAIPYSALQAAVGIEDSGRFTYHLKRLTGSFVEKTDEGYRLTPVGLAVVDAVHSGLLAGAGDRDPGPIDARCRDCGAALMLAYENGYATIRCDACGRTLSQFLFPPQGLAVRESADAAAAAFGAHVRAALDRAVAGVCPYCAGRSTVGSLADAGTVPQERVTFVARCRDCEARVTVSAAALVSFDPAVVSFLHGRDVDTRAPLWEQAWYHDATATVRERDPPTVDVTIAVDGDRLDLTVESDGERATVVVDGRE
jgi:hypothetical protein